VTRSQKANRKEGLNRAPRLRLVSEMGKISRISRPASIAITPRSLLGTDRRTAYQGRRYHSGTIEEGVTRALAST
jgi:hypothetical protein